MKSIVHDEQYGEIVLEESFWTGKKQLTIGNIKPEKLSKNTFSFNDGEKFVSVTLKGNSMTGVKMIVGERTIQLTPPLKWYDIVLALPGFILILVWGNSVSLCSILPVVGGAIGGGLSAVLAFITFIAIKSTNKIWLKILIALAGAAVTFLICCGIGEAIVAALTA